MTVREMLAQLRYLPRDAEVLAFEAGCEEYCERGSSCWAAVSTCISGPGATSRGGSSSGYMAEVDPDQDAALRRLRAAFGFVEVLEIVDQRARPGPGRGQASGSRPGQS